MFSILGIGPVFAGGCGVASLRAALEGSIQPRLSLAGLSLVRDSNLAPREPNRDRQGAANPNHDGEGAAVQTESGPVPVYEASVDDLDRFMPRRALRRLDKFTRMALLASFMAVKDAGLPIEDRSRIGIVFGTGFGPLETTFRYQDKIIDQGDRGASPTLFANSVHNAPASAVSIFMKIKGPCLTITNFERTTTEVLRSASAWLSRGTVDYVLAGVGDEYCAVLGYALRRLGAGKPNRDREGAAVHTESARIDPLRFDRCSYVPAEGFVTFLLGREVRNGAYARVCDLVSEPSCDRLDSALLAAHRAVFLAANGDRSSGRFYNRLLMRDLPVRDSNLLARDSNLRVRDSNLAPAGPRIAAYSPLYGSMPVGLGFDLALAGISCRAGRLYPSAAGGGGGELDLLTETTPLHDGERIGCLECSSHHATFISLAKH